MNDLRPALDWALNWIVANGVVPSSENQTPITRPASLPSDIEAFDHAAAALAALPPEQPEGQ
jgi:hypothetical protein